MDDPADSAQDAAAGQRPRFHWNYRVLIHDEGGEAFYAVHEVFYDEPVDEKTLKGISWTSNPIDFGGDDLEGVVTALIQALADAVFHPPLDVRNWVDPRL